MGLSDWYYKTTPTPAGSGKARSAKLCQVQTRLLSLAHCPAASQESVLGCRFLLPPLTPSLELAASSELSHGIPVRVRETYSTLTPIPAFQVHRARVRRATGSAWKVLLFSCTEAQRENNNQVPFLPSCCLSRTCEGPLIWKTEQGQETSLLAI